MTSFSFATFAARNPTLGEPMNQPKTAEEQANAAAIRELYASAEAAAKDTPKFVSFFVEGGYFYDVGAGKKYYGKDIGLTVDVYATASQDCRGGGERAGRTSR